MDPLLSIQIFHHPPVYRPGDLMRCDYQIDAVDAHRVSAVEASIVWVTEGKGDEDMGVHFFERRVPAEADNGDLRPLRTVVSVLPSSPLSYQGQLVQIRWRVRVRVFMKNGREFFAEKPFVLTTDPSSSGRHRVTHEC